MARGYRFSGTYIEKKERSLVTVLLVGIGVPWAVAGIMLWAGRLLWVEPPAVYALTLIAMIAAPLVTVVVVVTVAAILGGRSLTRYGWVLGLLFSLWFFVGLALTLGGILPWLGYAAGFAVLIGVFSLLGWRRGVPMWVGGTRATPVLKRYQRTGSGAEAASDVVDDLDRPLTWLPRAHTLARQVRAGDDPAALARRVTGDDDAERYAVASTVPFLVWKRLVDELSREHPTDFPEGAGTFFTPLHLTRRSAAPVAGARRLCRLSHRAMASASSVTDRSMTLAHHRRDTAAARLARRHRPAPDDVVAACLAEAVSLLVQRDVVLEVAAEVRR